MRRHLPIIACVSVALFSACSGPGSEQHNDTARTVSTAAGSHPETETYPLPNCTPDGAGRLICSTTDGRFTWRVVQMRGPNEPRVWASGGRYGPVGELIGPADARGHTHIAKVTSTETYLAKIGRADDNSVNVAFVPLDTGGGGRTSFRRYQAVRGPDTVQITIIMQDTDVPEILEP